ncbi:MAG: hypothetical protein ACRD5D_05280, partial [Candidatus Polarisedimenticolia bacterium]
MSVFSSSRAARERGGRLPAVLAVLLASGLGAIPAIAAPGDGRLYGTDGSGGNLYAIDPATAAATLIGPIGFSVPAIAVDPTTGVLYAGRGSGTANLYRLNPLTGAPTLVGNAGIGAASIAGLEFRADGVLFAAINAIDDGGTGADTLARINKATGAATVAGTFGGGIGISGGPGGIEALAFDASGVLFGASADQSLTGGPPSLYRINTTNGQATLVGPIADASLVAVSGGVASLQFGCDGTLYGGTGASTGNLVTIDPATARYAMVGHAVNRSLAGLAFQTGCGCRPVQFGGPLGWSARPPLPAGREAASGVIVGPRLFVSHGLSVGGSPAAETFIQDLNTGTWTTGAPAGVPRADLTGVCVEN